MDRVLSRFIVLLAMWMAGCTTVHMQATPQTLDRSAPWALLPVVNHTQTPQAGLRAEAILESLVRARGVYNLEKYPTKLNSESLFEPAERAAVDKALTWAQQLQVAYALTGTVDEWRYKVGVDGEPAVGITLQLIEMRTGRVVWTAAGSKTGWSREALSAVAQKLLSRLTQPLAMPSKTGGALPELRPAERNESTGSPAPSTQSPSSPLPSTQPLNPGTTRPGVRDIPPATETAPALPAVPDVDVEPAPLVSPAAPKANYDRSPAIGTRTPGTESRTASLHGN